MSDIRNEVASKGENGFKETIVQMIERKSTSTTCKKMDMKDPGQEILLERKNERKDEIIDPMKRLILERQKKNRWCTKEKKGRFRKGQAI